MQTSGIHHVTALASDPQRTLDFYAGTLGMRLVKRTVNFDAPTVHHFYFGDDRGRPGTLLTFFPFPNARAGERGAGQVTRVTLAVPEGSLDAWSERLDAGGVDGMERASGAGGEATLRFADPDGLPLALAEVPDGGDAEPAVRGIHGVTLRERTRGPTAGVLATLGFEGEERAEGLWRYRASEGPPAASEGPSHAGALVDLDARPGASPGSMSAGCVHHVAFRAADAEAQRTARATLLEEGLDVTPVLDRQYFRSIYFREPGGVLFEIATDGPGFDLDEPVDGLGSALRLPPWLEDRRDELEASLPAVEVPA